MNQLLKEVLNSFTSRLKDRCLLLAAIPINFLKTLIHCYYKISPFFTYILSWILNQSR
ncbi:hypothetical protein MtrunA17_Chr1g0202271 [Medicago truncatula]|uniref:Transmembrane protein n=1 Tax=Medicago truncatula TaxID=3880 RepID=A0A396K102_MEDTR|nr:hypothetical protein MtrunA17_Chr1g0202271 [Medicago truncatula]